MKTIRSFLTFLGLFTAGICFFFYLLYLFSPRLVNFVHGETAHKIGVFYFAINKPKQAAVWLQQAANDGHGEAANDLGVLYRYGTGVEKNIEKAMNLYRFAATKGDDFAMYNLGLNYSHLNQKTDNNSVKTDLEQAVYWYQKAVEKENYCAANDLGILYASGLGVKQNTMRAKKYFVKSVVFYLKQNTREIKRENFITQLELLNFYELYQFAQASHKRAEIIKNIPPTFIQYIQTIDKRIKDDCWE